MICIFGFIIYLISNPFSLFALKESILFTLGKKKLLLLLLFGKLFGNIRELWSDDSSDFF